ncbi:MULTISPECIES: methylthioribulose 1-phosphate dehydratase [Methylococcus]|uniref:Methylthioribulose-1-phosphate dehydratase n=1 Tax=Methylococcus capsulatus TaxID=414 RepID=A0ABZ2FBE3_METCP|nr:methylthioribulose 1-phosphate dehydratase [Methylococcus capsulatus]
MLRDTEFETRAAELIEAGRFIDSRGWVPATSGNFSARLSDGRIAITVSGRHKGRLRPEDIMLVDAAGRSLDGRKPSAETLLHTGIYRRYPEAGAVLHPHSPASTLLSRLVSGEVILEDYELLKALAGIDTHATRIAVPIFPNDQNIPRLALKIEEYIEMHGDIYAYIIAGHGFYTWGRSVADALRHVEALEFLFALETHMHGVKR